MRISDELSNKQILAVIGRRLSTLRLDKNLTQAELATTAGVAKRTVERIEQGESAQLLTLVKIFRVLGLMEELENLIPLPELTDDEIHQRRKQRLRASGKRGTPLSSWKWMEEQNS